MGEVEKLLAPGERIVYQAARVHPAVHAGPLVITALTLYPVLTVVFTADLEIALPILLAYSVIPVLLHGSTEIRRGQTEAVVTSERVVLRKPTWSGFREESISLRKIEGVSVEQGALGGQYNFGNVVVSGSGNSRLTFAKIENPTGFRKAIGEQMTGTANTPLAD